MRSSASRPRRRSRRSEIRQGEVPSSDSIPFRKLNRCNSGCRGRAPAAAERLQATNRWNAAVARRLGQAGSRTTRNEVADRVEADARVHAEQWPVMQRDHGFHNANTAVQEPDPCLPFTEPSLLGMDASGHGVLDRDPVSRFRRPRPPLRLGDRSDQTPWLRHTPRRRGAPPLPPDLAKKGTKLEHRAA